LLDALGDKDLLIVLGNGDRQLETFLGECASRRANILFLRGYSETLSEQLYASGDLFLMPSNFEPCGISQMLAMRSGQPCLVNQVGGLADTVEDGITGYVFSGASDKDRAQALLRRWCEALDLLRHSPDKTRSMRKAAASKRFMWKTAAQAYVKNLYCSDTAVKGARATAGK
jgi:starch synthase